MFYRIAFRGEKIGDSEDDAGLIFHQKNPRTHAATPADAAGSHTMNSAPFVGSLVTRLLPP